MKNSIILTGDIHGNIDRILKIPDENLTKNDVVIILGDFGVIWSPDDLYTEAILQRLAQKNFTVAFVDGNHENFPLINEMQEIKEWNGGRAGFLPYGIIHLLRGEIYNINDRVIGVCGGANSIDKAWRIDGESWWKEEEITQEDVLNFTRNLKGRTHLDMILSHDCPAEVSQIISKLYVTGPAFDVSPSQYCLEQIKQCIQFDKWYFGHWHINKEITDKYECLYENVKEV